MAAPRKPVRVENAEFGGAEFVLIAGPCAVESESQLLQAAEAAAEAGARQEKVITIRRTTSIANHLRLIHMSHQLSAAVGAQLPRDQAFRRVTRTASCL